MTITVGVIGTGNIGTDHARRLAGRVSGAEVGAVFDIDGARAKQVAAEVGAVALDRATDVVDDPSVDAIVIASPGHTHADLVLACIAADKPVLCEKPLATTADGCLEVLEAEAGHGRRLVRVGFMRRYDEGYRVVKAALDDGSIGEPLLLHCIHRNPTVPATFTTEMTLTDSVVHEIDAARWLLGEEIVAVRVLGTRRSPHAGDGLQDPVLVLLESASGVVVEVELFVNCRYGYDVRCEVVGSAGTVELGTPGQVALTRDGRRGGVVPPDWRVRFGTAYLDELQEWVDDLAAGRPAGTGRAATAWDGYAANAVAEAGVAALADGGGRIAVTLTGRPAFYS